MKKELNKKWNKLGADIDDYLIRNFLANLINHPNL